MFACRCAHVEWTLCIKIIKLSDTNTQLFSYTHSTNHKHGAPSEFLEGIQCVHVSDCVWKRSLHNKT